MRAARPRRMYRCSQDHKTYGAIEWNVQIEDYSKVRFFKGPSIRRHDQSCGEWNSQSEKMSSVIEIKDLTSTRSSTRLSFLALE